jgi:hypothetical protein
VERLFALWLSRQTRFEIARDRNANEVIDLADVRRDSWCTDASWNCARIMRKPKVMGSSVGLVARNARCPQDRILPNWSVDRKQSLQRQSEHPREREESAVCASGERPSNPRSGADRSPAQLARKRRFTVHLASTKLVCP